MSFTQSKFVSTTSVDSIIKASLVVNICPNWDMVQVLPTLIKKSGLNGNTRLGSAEFTAVFYSLVFLRLDSSNIESRFKVEQILRHATLPLGIQSIIRNLPLGGLMYRLKDHQVKFELSNKIVDYVNKSLKNGSLALHISEMSRHLNSNNNARRESFNENFLTSGNKYFILNSFFRKNEESVSTLSRADLELNLNSRVPDLNIGVSLTFIFGFTCEQEDNLNLLLGIVGRSSLSPSDNDLNVQNAFEFMMSDSGSDTTSGIQSNNMSRTNSDSSDVKKSPKPEGRYNSLLNPSDVVGKNVDSLFKYKSINLLIEKLVRKILSEVLNESRLDKSNLSVS
jgi:hypothetical protein